MGGTAVRVARSRPEMYAEALVWGQGQGRCAPKPRGHLTPHVCQEAAQGLAAAGAAAGGGGGGGSAWMGRSVIHP